jgi:hypothetical protein
MITVEQSPCSSGSVRVARSAYHFPDRPLRPQLGSRLIPGRQPVSEAGEQAHEGVGQQVGASSHAGEIVDLLRYGTGAQRDPPPRVEDDDSRRGSGRGIVLASGEIHQRRRPQPAGDVRCHRPQEVALLLPETL